MFDGRGPTREYGNTSLTENVQREHHPANGLTSERSGASLAFRCISQPPTRAYTYVKFDVGDPRCTILVMAARIFSRSGLLGFMVCSAFGCGSPALVQCRVEAVKFLPDDPRQLTPYDVEDLIVRLHACKVSPGDAGHG